MQNQNSISIILLVELFINLDGFAVSYLVLEILAVEISVGKKVVPVSKKVVPT